MFKRIALPGLVSFLLCACSAPAATTSAVALGQPVTLSPGRQAVIAGEDLEVRFSGILADSRCPTGATCVWQGEVTVDLAFPMLIPGSLRKKVTEDIEQKLDQLFA